MSEAIQDQSYVTALFADTEKAARAVDDLVDASFPSEQIGLLVRDESQDGRAGEATVDAVAVEHEVGVFRGGIAGTAIGATLGAVGAGLVSVGTLPAVGLGLAAAGPIAAIASGGAAGAAGGGLLGTLAGLGFWTETTDLPDELGRGAVLVSAPAESDRAEDAREILEKAGAEWVQG